MLTKSDAMSILVRLEDNGLNIDTYMKKLLISKDIPVDVLQFIVKNQGIEVTDFYELLREKHNKNNSKLYTNLLKDEISIEDMIITLSSLLTQISLHYKKLEKNRENFIKESRAAEITRALQTFFNTENTEECTKLFSLIKTDILVLEYLSGKRELAE